MRFMNPRISIHQLIRRSLAVALLAAFLMAPGPAHAQEPAGSQGLWQTFTTANSGLRDNSVTALLEDRVGGVWVGTKFGGVSRYFQGAWQTFSVEAGSLGSNRVTALLEDRADGVWVGTEFGGVSRYFEGTWQTFSVENGSLGNSFLERWLQSNRARLKIHEASQVSDQTELGVIRQERIAFLRQQRATHRKNLNRLQEQAAIYGVGEVPLRLLNQIEAEEREIQRIGAELEQLCGKT